MKTTDPEVTTPKTSSAEPLQKPVPTASTDPVVAAEVGHPVGVGIGALGAGAAGAAIGAVAGPIGMLVGAVVGAVAGGLVGEEMASAGDLAETDNPDSSYTAPDLLEPTSLATQSTSYGMGAEPASGSLLSGADEDVRVLSDRVPNLAGTRPPVDIETPNVEVVLHAPPSQISSGALEVASPSHGVYSEDLVRTSAYYRYVERELIGREGDALGDWVEAEHELQGA